MNISPPKDYDDAKIINEFVSAFMSAQKPREGIVSNPMAEENRSVERVSGWR